MKNVSLIPNVHAAKPQNTGYIKRFLFKTLVLTEAIIITGMFVAGCMKQSVNGYFKAGETIFRDEKTGKELVLNNAYTTSGTAADLMFINGVWLAVVSANKDSISYRSINKDETPASIMVGSTTLDVQCVSVKTVKSNGKSELAARIVAVEP